MPDLIVGDACALPLGDDTVDAIVTDPPYGLEFMGKAWDRHGTPKAFQQWCELWAGELLRVLKPGGHLLSFGGTRTYHRMVCALEDAGFEIRDCLFWFYGTGFPKSLNISKAIEKAGDERAAKWDGWGTALKPAVEPIVLARKPLIGTVAANVLEHRTGGLNVDGCRIAGRVQAAAGNVGGYSGSCTGQYEKGTGWEVSHDGRWPANLLLDPEAAAVLDEQSGEVGGAPGSRHNTAAAHNQTTKMGKAAADWKSEGYSDSGGASRFFYVAKPTKKERTCDGYIGNTHVTVKPITLMRYLCRLVTPPDGLILDPFVGSGTTGMAAAKEGFRFLGIELSPEHIATAELRIAWAEGRIDCA